MKKCTCGAEAVDSPKHSKWCDTQADDSAAAYERDMVAEVQDLGPPHLGGVWGHIKDRNGKYDVFLGTNCRNCGANDRSLGVIVTSKGTTHPGCKACGGTFHCRYGVDTVLQW